MTNRTIRITRGQLKKLIETTVGTDPIAQAVDTVLKNGPVTASGMGPAHTRDEVIELCRDVKAELGGNAAAMEQHLVMNDIEPKTARALAQALVARPVENAKRRRPALSEGRSSDARMMKIADEIDAINIRGDISRGATADENRMWDLAVELAGLLKRSDEL